MPAKSTAFPPPDGFDDSSVSSHLADESDPQEFTAQQLDTSSTTEK